MKFDEVMAELKGGKFRPFYLLQGDEPYYIDTVANYIEQHALSEADKAFNQTILYGRDVNATTVVHEADQYPMMAERRLVIVREAQDISDLSPFDMYAKHLQEKTILVLCYKKKIDKRLSLIKTVEKVGCVMESTALRAYEMPAWLTSYVKSQGLSIEEKANSLLCEAVGSDLSNMVSAIEKLKLVAESSSQKVITSQLVTQNIGISNEYNNFEFRDAIFSRDIAKVNRIVKAYSENEKAHPIQPIIAYLYNEFLKLFSFIMLGRASDAEKMSALGVSQYALKTYAKASSKYTIQQSRDIIYIIRRYDARSKGFNYPAIPKEYAGDLLKEMVARIVYCR
ncbi:MAG: DNA polymerase III subunit delta [Marinilabiliaceae bacterium]|nr:DNA polymerase III subunit delta [Marinilabiliaceae bacterium]